MKRHKAKFLLAGLFLLGTAQSIVAEQSREPAGEWNFDVYLDDKKVGTHRFEVVDSGQNQFVESHANFKVKVLFFNAYSYEHSNIERWSGDCLLRFDARTRVNGEPTEVSGSSEETGFVVETDHDRKLLPGCVMSFAYWNPEFLKQEKLLNPQTGEFLDVDVKSMGTDTLEVRGVEVRAQRYKVTARDIDLLLWYSADEQWLSLESTAKGGRVIRYELS